LWSAGKEWTNVWPFVFKYRNGRSGGMIAQIKRLWLFRRTFICPKGAAWDTAVAWLLTDDDAKFDEEINFDAWHWTDYLRN
jgi:hypothetical protein